MSRTCVFCGYEGKLTLEHVFPDWLHTIGIAVDPVVLKAGPLNQIGREFAPPTPYSTQARDVCGPCNHGWMKRLENVAGRVLSPWIRGELSAFIPSDHGAIALWLQKTALVSLLVSAANGRGLPETEYHALYEQRERPEPLPSSSVWIGRYGSPGPSPFLWVTPLVVSVHGMAEPEWPQGYAMTLVLGELLLHGVRLTTPLLDLDLTAPPGLLQLWPTPAVAVGAVTTSVMEETLRALAEGKAVTVSDAVIRLRPWKAAIELPEGQLVGSMVESPTICGKHVTYYPALLAHEALLGHFAAFMTSCECGIAYLIETEAEGAHCKASGTPEGISDRYETLPGEELGFEDENGGFVFKWLPAASRGHDDRAAQR